MAPSALAMQLIIDDCPDDASDLVKDLVLLKFNNEHSNPVNGQLRAWINDRLTALANLSSLRPHIRENILDQTRQSVEKLINDPIEELRTRPEPVLIEN